MTEQPGVWMLAEDIPFEGIVKAVPFATETDALRAGNDDKFAEVYFVPFGSDLREVIS
jgi:hypothetical protein